MKRVSILLSVLVAAACTPVDVPQAESPVTSSQAPTAKKDAGVENSSSAALTAASSAAVTRHLPGTIITTATGKYVYLVQSDGTIAPFASAALVTASGYTASMVITVSAAELYCYGTGDEITVVLPPPVAGRLRDGALVKEKGKSDTYVISDSMAWPIMNGQVFTEAGYDFANVTEIPAGSLAGKVQAIGNCVAGIVCLDEAYLLTCAKEVVGDLTPDLTNTATSTSTASGTSTTTVAVSSAMRHLPGTIITTATGKYVYLVQSDGTAAPFANVSLVTASGYPAAAVITVTAEELYCYGRGETIMVALPPPAAGRLREGGLYKEKGKTDTYAISEGVAWPILNGQVFADAGYNFANVIELAAGSLAPAVAAVGNCASGVACLDETYLRSCAQDDAVDPTTTTTATDTATATATVSATTVPTVTPTATATSVATTPNTATATTVATSTLTQSATNTASATATSTMTTTTASVTPTVTATTTATSTSSATATASNPAPGTIDLSWVYAADGSKLCLNAVYFAGADKAVLLIWTGPGADAAKGPVVLQTTDRFCWDFMNREKGLYYFWADVPDGSCSTDICPRDAIPGNGAMYMTAPKATASARKWLACQPTGCDGAAYWDGTAFTPMGG